MSKSIATYLNMNGETTSLYDQGKIVVYEKELGQWHIVRERPFMLNKSAGLRGLRQSMLSVVDFLDNCKIFVGIAIAGVPYFELEKAHCSVWEFQGRPEDFLEYVLTKEEEVPANAEQAPLIPQPEEITGGCYRISLTDIQTNNTGITSKQVLLPFLQQGKYYSLEVLCRHVPPWLENELLAGKISGEIEKIGKNLIRVVISRPCCP